MSGPKVVAVLAVAILALPPVVNAILEKAAQQAQVEWLRPDGEGEFEGSRAPEGPLPDLPAPPPPPPPSQRPCRPEPAGPDPVVLPPGVGTGGRVALTAEPGDLAVLALVEGRGVTGQPLFRLLQDGEEVWRHQELHLNEDLRLPPGKEGVHPAPEPGEEWVLSWTAAGTLHQGLRFQLAVLRCGEGP